VKAQDIQVFDTEHLSALFERVIVASGTSNRQTKALAASVRDAVREAGFPKPRVEGEANGEWIIVDCAQAVVHIMQPIVRQYYHLEDLWGDKPVRMKFGAAKPVAPPKVPAKTAAKTGAKPAAGRKTVAKSVAPKPAALGAAKRAGHAARPAPGAKVPAKAVAKSATKSAAKTPAKRAVPSTARPAARKPARGV
jgi:ribosome-associated protein